MRRRLFVLGCLCLFALTITRAQAPGTDFSATPTSGCGPLGVTFKDLSTNSPTAWNWDFGNGQSSTLQNPTCTYATPGTYTVTLIARNASGANVMRKSNYITVYPSPTPQFTSNLTLACAPATVQFTDQSIAGQGSITAWAWDFGDGTTSNQQNPTHVYTQTGYYSVSLTVTNSGGCSLGKGASRYLRVVQGVQPNFAYDQTSTSCTAPYAVHFLNQTSGPGNLTFNWSLGTNAVPANSTDTNPNVTYPSAGTYTINLQVTSSLGCGNSIQKTVTFANNNAVLNGPTAICINSPASFSNGSTPLPPMTTWDFGDGTGANTNTATKTYAALGTYTVKLVNKYAACADSTTQSVSVVNPPTAKFTSAPLPAAVCKPSLTVNFTDQSTPTPTAWHWDFGDGQTSTVQNPTHSYSTTGTFTVSLTVTGIGSCSDTATQTALVKVQGPVATIRNANGLGSCVKGTGAESVVNPSVTVNSVDAVTSYAWSAPGSNEGSSTAAVPSFTYNTAGNYTISVIVTTAGGCTSPPATSSVSIGTSTPATFTISPASPICGNNPVTFTIPAKPPPGSSWIWLFGDGTTSGVDTANLTISHSYNIASPPPIQAGLTVSHNGCPTTSIQTLNILPPIPKFGYAVGCPGLTVNFTDLSFLGGTTPTSYTWDFGDGNTSALQNPTHTYGNIGTYTVVLTLVDGGCTDTATRTIVLGSVNPTFTMPPNACRNAFFTLTNTSTSTPANFIASSSYAIGGNPPVLAGPTYTAIVSTNGPTNIQLIETDINGCQYPSAIQTVQITGPFAKFAIPPTAGGCKNGPIVFTDQSTPYPGTAGPPAAPASTINSWAFNFGNGATQTYNTGPTFTYQYPDTGVYTVQLKVTDAAGCTDTFTAPTTVQITAPVANFSGPDSFYCPGVPLTFIDSSIGYGLTDSWAFGDGSPVSPTPTHTYTTSGQTYNVTLTVTDKNNCTSTKTKPVQIQKPIAAFDISDTTAICAPLETMFTAHGQYYDSLYWNFGDGSTSTLPTTSHFYNTTDTFTAKLFVEGPGGCFDSASRRVLVLDPYTTTAFFYGPPLKACDSVPVQFTIIPPGYTSFSLSFGDNTFDSSGNENPFHMYRVPNQYEPILTLTDATGCIVSFGSNSGPITVLGAVPFFSPSISAFCDSATVNLNDFTFSNDGIASETYSYGDGSPNASLTPGTGSFNVTHFYNQVGNFPATLKVVTNSGCTESYTDTIRDYQTPHPGITTTGAPCAGLIQFDGSISATQVDSITWQWNFGNGQSSTEQNPLVRMAAGQYTVILKATVPPIGCFDTTSASIVVNPLPVITGPNEITTPLGIPVTIPFAYSPNNIVTYNWTPTANLDCATCPNPVATLMTDATYTVTVTDANSCTASDTIFIKTICNDKNYFLPNTFTPNGDGVNDYFYPRGTSLYNIQSLTIFNRWGQMVFQRRNFPANASTMGWDGTFNGHPAPADAYVYIAEVICDNSQVIALHGNVTLIR